MKRKISVVTGTRAEYGLLYWLLKTLQDDPTIELQLIVTGMHLSPEFGLTYRQIEGDGFYINEKVETVLSSDTPVGIAKSVGLGVIGFANALERLKPDIMVVLGDRYEIFAAAQAAMVARIPIAHIHGGELTYGLIDDPIRHSITKMAQLHFTVADAYRRRVIQLGEHPDRVFNVGALGVENIKRLKLLKKRDFEQAINLKLSNLKILVTYHPVTLNIKNAENEINELLRAMETFKEATIIFTKSNSDTEGRVINSAIEKFVKKYPKRMKLYDSLGQLRYLSAIKHVDIVVGNSSSGILEVPYFEKPTVNIGDRQSGRLKSESVIDTVCKKEKIIEAINMGITDDFQQKCQKEKKIFGNGNTAIKIKESLKSLDLTNFTTKKVFFDCGD